MTRPLPKRTTRRVRRNRLFPDALEVLRRGEAVRVAPVRPCEVCGSEESEKREMRTFDGHVCVDELGCWRRQNKARRVT